MENSFKREFQPKIDFKFTDNSKTKPNNQTKEEIISNEVKRVNWLITHKYARAYIHFLCRKNQNNHYVDAHFKTFLPLSTVKENFLHWTYKEGTNGNGNNSIKQIDRNTYSIRLYIDWHDDSIMFLYQSEGR